MSAAYLFCYEPQRHAVVSWMYEVSAPVSSRNPVGVDEHGYRLQGAEHINFIEIVGHPNPIPERVMRILRDRGAIIIKVDDSWSRARRVIAEHHPAREDA